MEKIDKFLKLKAVRITPMRQLLLEFFFKENRPLGLIELEKRFPKSDRITMYRTLKTFEKKGIIHGIDIGKAEVKYALCKERCSPANHIDQHPHFHCEKCGQITCVEDVYTPSVKLPEGYVPKKISMTIKGVCKNCQE